MTPPLCSRFLNPHGHLVFQASRGDVHTVWVNGKIVKHQHKLVDVDLSSVRRTVEQTVDHLREEMGEDEWISGMSPDIPESKILDNPYTYTDFRTDTTRAVRGA